MLIAELYDVCERGYVDRDINKHKILIPQHPKFHKTPPPPLGRRRKFWREVAHNTYIHVFVNREVCM